MSEFARAVRSTTGRCPACGQHIKQPLPTRCPLCDFDFRDSRVTGADVTPYAKCFSMGVPGWRRMSEWVWFAGWERLKHLALMRASAASRRFALVNMLMLAGGLGVFQATVVGWRWVTAAPATEPTGSTGPTGAGWIHVVAAPRPLPPDQPAEIPVDLWWSPAQMLIATATAIVAGLIVMWAVLAIVRAGVRLAHRRAYRSEQRMTAALHYSAAWGVPVVLAALVLGLRPVAFAGKMAQWSWYPDQRGLLLAAAVLAGFGVTMWWFWLWRLGAAAPARTRGRVIGFFALGTPLIAGLAAAGWWLGLRLLYAHLFTALGVNF